jgi:hypothetical protein
MPITKLQEENKIIRAAQIRYEQTNFPSTDPCLNYKLGYLQGFYDALQQNNKNALVTRRGTQQNNNRK